MSDSKLSEAFYRQSDVVKIARQLVGKVLCTNINNQLTKGIITETEAYRGRGDKACHASGGTRTDRTETMYKSGGIAYIYLCYGIHHLFNVVTNAEDKADAVLIRAIKPIAGKKMMLQRRNAEEIAPVLTAGPGRLTQAMGITKEHDTTSLAANKVWITDGGNEFSEEELIAKPRIGVQYAGEDADLPWRFYPKSCSWVSKK